MCAYMLTQMDTTRLVEGARKASGLSVRALADAADVAGTTITRTQSGAVDPSMGTLERIIAAAGFDLSLVVRRSNGARRPSLAPLSAAWTTRRGRIELQWPMWRALLDDLALHPELVAEAIYVPPWPAGEPVIDALLAAIAEKLADDAGLPRPLWTADAPALAEPYVPPTARRVKGRTVPPQLAARLLMIDTESLWRDRTTVGV